MPQNLIQPRLQPQVNYLYEIKISSFLKIIDDTTLVQKCYKEQELGKISLPSSYMKWYHFNPLLVFVKTHLKISYLPNLIFLVERLFHYFMLWQLLFFF